MDSAKKYFVRVGIALSVLLNVILGGYSNQAFSARNYAWHLEGKPNLVFLIDAMFFREENHCMNSWLYWVKRKDL
jgi:hypothetical protein